MIDADANDAAEDRGQDRHRQQRIYEGPGNPDQRALILDLKVPDNQTPEQITEGPQLPKRRVAAPKRSGHAQGRSRSGLRFHWAKIFIHRRVESCR